ncbi:hypothetical protein SteCoe_38045 [Stentor coeruleus]|uniref:Uncharacterized protein n=1 Tax=Stentor coeruleus TaxID=5963 RepID=A0A1R2AM88_9CILI|nr:hypothetical protein SteCoe_38045 [Stentor coeruleus]
MHSGSILNNIFYVFGGLNELSQCSSELYSLNCENWIWQSLGNFCVDGVDMKMCGHAAVCNKDQMIMFGGLDPETGTIYNQLFVYNIQQKNWGRTEKRKSPRFCGSLVVIGNKMLMLGGCNLVDRRVPKVESMELETLEIDLLG